MGRKYNSFVEKYLSYFEQKPELAEIYKKKVSKDYLSGLPELEIAALLWRRKVAVDPDPKLPTGKKADLRAQIYERDCFFEITVIAEASKDVIREKPTRFQSVVAIEIPNWKEPSKRRGNEKFLLDKIVSKIMGEIAQLPKGEPNILVINIEDSGVFNSDVMDALLGLPHIIIDEHGKLREEREEFKPFRTMEELLQVLNRVSAFVVYEKRELREADIGFNEMNALNPLTEKEKEFLVQFLRSQ